MSEPPHQVVNRQLHSMAASSQEKKRTCVARISVCTYMPMYMGNSLQLHVYVGCMVYVHVAICSYVLLRMYIGSDLSPSLL